MSGDPDPKGTTTMSVKLPARVPRRATAAPRAPQATASKQDARKTRVYFHCSNTLGVFVDPCGIDVEDLIEAHACAAQVVRAYIGSHTLDDWRGWVLHVSDPDEEELFVMPFTSALGPLQ
jgi:hypothetical protein